MRTSSPSRRNGTSLGPANNKAYPDSTYPGTGGDGGVIYNAGTMTVSGCTLDRDSAYQGGGVYNAGTLTVTGSTLSGDSATNAGGGIANAGTLTVLDSIFSTDTPDDIYGSFTDGGGNTFN